MGDEVYARVFQRHPSVGLLQWCSTNRTEGQSGSDSRTWRLGMNESCFRSSAGIMIRHWKGFIIWICPSRLDSFDSFRKNGIIVFRCVPVFSDVYTKVCSINLQHRSSVFLCFVGPCSLGYFRVQSEAFCGSWSIFFAHNEHFLLFSGESCLSQTNLIEWSQCFSSVFSFVCISLLLNRWLRCSLPMYHDWFHPMSKQRTSTAARSESNLFPSRCDHSTARHL